MRRPIQHLWIIDATKESYVSASGKLSTTYVLPRAEVYIDIEKLPGTYLWIVLRGKKGDVVYRILAVEYVEQFEEGYYTGDFLITISMSRSSALVASYRIGQPINRDLFKNYTPGLFVLEDNLHVDLVSSVSQKIRRSISKPGPRELKRVLESEAPSGDPEQLLRSIVARYSMDEIWAGSGAFKQSPYAYFACCAAEEVNGSTMRKHFSQCIKSDPVSILLVASKAPPDVLRNDRPPKVDTILVPIDPNKIFIRKFLAHSDNPSNAEERVRKTQNAEKQHQDMLRDVCTFLLDRDFQPKQSCSVDLFINTGGANLLFELKSANNDNILSQVAAGIFQLGCYRKAFDLWNKMNNRMVLLIQSFGNQEMAEYVSDIGRSFGVEVMMYDIEKPWPDRVTGISGNILEVMKN